MSSAFCKVISVSNINGENNHFSLTFINYEYSFIMIIDDTLNLELYKVYHWEHYKKWLLLLETFW